MPPKKATATKRPRAPKKTAAEVAADLKAAAAKAKKELARAKRAERRPKRDAAMSAIP